MVVLLHYQVEKLGQGARTWKFVFFFSSDLIHHCFFYIHFTYTIYSTGFLLVPSNHSMLFGLLKFLMEEEE
ncbi:hypothetical protein P153DRAFT_120503 [Dothidotthia symphoricarpi CBS 119687]|uniref:Uncharacterized protein n=1 Tax=Dothidotthia symphoricarpi CBS 119687 TaxID=1392245 RepID=A0A6A5ZZX5_9PLEO|nr:uncharacterized protein P153DRAFT_120503 [Dothidotthia symphoricarpi CBS 119687]KAF2125100.1 hypothetical protein P153DRAFT_120503 [Dothidotthia symphoricarpi CBS 119687]